MDRATVLESLQNEFAPLSTAFAQATTDTAAGYGPAIDQALRQLGFVADALATAEVVDADAPAYQELARYYALRRFATAATLSVDEERQTGTGKRSRSNLAGKVNALLDDARERIEALGYGAGGFQIGYLTLDYLEPSESAV